MGLIGYTTDEVMGRSLVQEFITEDFKMPVQAVLDKALAGNETGLVLFDARLISNEVTISLIFILYHLSTC